MFEKHARSIIVYHGTDARSAINILKRGFVTDSSRTHAHSSMKWFGVGDRSAVPVHYPMDKEGIYASSDIDVAVSFANQVTGGKVPAAIIRAQIETRTDGIYMDSHEITTIINNVMAKYMYELDEAIQDFCRFYSYEEQKRRKHDILQLVKSIRQRLINDVDKVIDSMVSKWLDMSNPKAQGVVNRLRNDKDFRYMIVKAMRAILGMGIIGYTKHHMSYVSTAYEAAANPLIREWLPCAKAVGVWGDRPSDALYEALQALRYFLRDVSIIGNVGQYYIQENISFRGSNRITGILSWILDRSDCNRLKDLATYRMPGFSEGSGTVYFAILYGEMYPEAQLIWNKMVKYRNVRQAFIVSVRDINQFASLLNHVSTHQQSAG